MNKRDTIAHRHWSLGHGVKQDAAKCHKARLDMPVQEGKGLMCCYQRAGTNQRCHHKSESMN